MKKILLTFFLISAVLLGGCIFLPVKTHTDINTIPSPTPPIELTATKLIKAYKDDAAAANKKYLAVEMVVSGVVKEFGTNESGIPYLVLTVTATDTTGVYCTFPDGYDKILAGLKIGQTSGITGKCRGLENGNVLLDSR
jgi:hypothetical protein